MEFFASCKTGASASDLQETLHIRNLPSYCQAVDKVLEDHGDTGKVYCLWGEFQVHREAINGGLRFTLPGCPNSLAWTVTTGHEPVADDTVIHLTISRQEHEPDFIESLEYFVDELKQGLMNFPALATADR